MLLAGLCQPSLGQHYATVASLSSTANSIMNPVTHVHSVLRAEVTHHPQPRTLFVHKLHSLLCVNGYEVRPACPVQKGAYPTSKNGRACTEPLQKGCTPPACAALPITGCILCVLTTPTPLPYGWLQKMQTKSAAVQCAVRCCAIMRTCAVFRGGQQHTASAQSAAQVGRPYLDTRLNCHSGTSA